MDLLNGRYKIENEELNVVLKERTGKKKKIYEKVGNKKVAITTDEDDYKNLGWFATVQKAILYLYHYHLRRELDGLEDIEEIKNVIFKCTEEVKKAIEGLEVVK